MLRKILPILVLMGLALPVRAQTQMPARLDELISAIRLDERLEIMAEEGRGHGRRLREQMFPDVRSDRWDRMVVDICDLGRAAAAFTIGEDI